jgi:hypothetical protein
MKRIIALVLVVFLLAACTPSQASVVDSGVEGQVTIGSMCPVVRLDQSCPDKPYQAILKVFNLDGKNMGQIQTDVNGKYRLALPPGDYILHPEAPDRMTHGQDQPFSVVAGLFTKVAIVYDNGIR